MSEKREGCISGVRRESSPSPASVLFERVSVAREMRDAIMGYDVKKEAERVLSEISIAQEQCAVHD